MSLENGYCFCANEWFLNPALKNELPLLLLISTLSAKLGYCFADNSYFAEHLRMDETTISKKLSKLQKLGLLTITYEKRGCEVVKREIRLVKLCVNMHEMPTDDCSECQPTIGENANRTYNKINNNIINNNNISITRVKTRQARTFTPPTLEEWLEYARKNELKEDRLTSAYRAYEVAEWHDSYGKPIRNWKQKMLQVWCKDENKDPDAWLNMGPKSYEEAVAEAKAKGLM